MRDLWQARLSRRDLFKLGIVTGANLVVGAACGEKSRLGGPSQESVALNLANKLQKEALNRGELKFPLAKIMQDEKAEIFDPSPIINLIIGFPVSNKNIVIPALFEGRVSRVLPFDETQPQPKHQQVEIEKNGRTLHLLIGAKEIKLIIKEGEMVELGDPLVEISLDYWKTDYGASGGASISFLDGECDMEKPSCNAKLIHETNFLRDSTGNIIYIPTKKSAVRRS